MNQNPIDLYLDLMKSALSFSLWEETGVPIETYINRKSFLKRICLRSLSLLRFAGLKVVKEPTYTQNEKDDGMIWPGQAHTMAGLKRLDNVRFCVEDVIKNNIQGDLIETGVWRGGSCIFMRAILAAHGIKDKRIFVADSFEGLPKPDKKNYPRDRHDKLHTETFLAISKEEVEDNFKKYSLLDEQVIFVKGWFKDTLSTVPSDKFAVIRLDGDMYQSTMEALTSLYHRLSIGGYCIIDDYGIKHCKEAVDDFRAENNINTPLQKIDWTGVFWRKE